MSGCRVTELLPWPRNPLPTGPVNTPSNDMLPNGSVQIEDVDADGDRYVVHLRVFVSSNKASDQGGVATPTATGTPTPSDGRATATATQSPDGASTAPDGTSSATPTSAGGRASAVATASPSTAPNVQGPTPPAATPGDFDLDPGAYTSFVRLKGTWLRTVATPVTVTRSEDTEGIPLLIGLVGGLCGFVVFMLLRQVNRDKLLVKEKNVLRLTAAVCVSVGAGTAFFTNYWNQEVWTWHDNGLALFIAAFTASTTGVAAGLLGGIYKTTAAASAGQTTPITPAPKG